jgi:hypothetical protein
MAIRQSHIDNPNRVSVVLKSILVQKRENSVRKITIAILLFSVLVWAGEDANPADYTVNVHVSSSSNANNMQELSVIIDGKHYDLQSRTAAPDRLLALGDYKAKLVQGEHQTAYDSYQVYEFLFSDKKQESSWLSGRPNDSTPLWCPSPSLVA